MKVLIISHDASRTGAPILLLSFSRLLNEYNIQTEFLIKYSGDLDAEFQSLGATKVYYKKESNSLFFRGKKKLFGRPHNTISDLDWDNYDYILSNTITNGDILEEIKRFHSVPVLSYIHEMRMAARFFTTPEGIDSVKRHSDYYITPSNAVRQYLINTEKIPEEKIEVLPSYIPPKIASKDDSRQGKLDDFFYVGSAGTVDWRKSPDLFVQVVRLVFSKEPKAKIKFLWKGAPSGGIELERFFYDIDMTNLSDKIEVAKASGNMEEWYQKLDVFLLTSREDPYPLVVLEAAAAGVPTICFDKAGGAPEFVQFASAGRAVSYLDTGAMADAILFYYNNKMETKREGLSAFEALKTRHQDVGMIISTYSNIVKKLFSYAKKNTPDSNLSSPIPSNT